MTKNNKTTPSLKNQLNRSSAMEAINQTTSAIHGLTSLLSDCLDPSAEHPAQLSQKHLVSITTAITCLNRQTETEIEELVDTADTLSCVSH